jgi:signal transduction histidine kinase
MTICGSLFDSGSFMPHGGCYLWSQSLIALQAISDGLIALAYYSIPFTILYFVRKREDLKFQWIFVSFAIFVLACGTTHLMEIWNIWHADYWLSGAIKAITAVVSVSTAILLVRLLPKALALPGADALEKARAELEIRVHDRTAELVETARNLEAEIAERKHAEQQIVSLNASLEQRVRDRTTELEAANQELESFAYSVSHDLRAPLRGINGWSNALVEDYGDRLDEQGREFLTQVCGEAQRMGQLIDDLLQLSRLSRVEMSREPVDLSAIARGILARLGQHDPSRRVQTVIASGLMAYGDPQLLQVAIQNLLENAWKFTSKCLDARIEIGLIDKSSDDTAGSSRLPDAPSAPVFFIRDNGAGFDMAHTAKLFAPFQRLHRQSEFPGTGIGLASVQRIIHRHGGRIWAMAEPGKGVTFCFTLPVTPSTL